MGKVALVKYPALPSTCLVCNGSADGKKDFVDWGMNVDWYGALVICEFCIVECLETVGAASKQRHERILRALAEVRAQNAELSAELEKYRNVVVSLDIARPDLKLVSNDGD